MPLPLLSKVISKKEYPTYFNMNLLYAQEWHESLGYSFLEIT